MHRLDKQKPGQFHPGWKIRAGYGPAACVGAFSNRTMALAAKLQLRQSQSLVMTPQLMQSIRLLQLTHLELERFVDEEIERNPLLERAEPREDARRTEAGRPMPHRSRPRKPTGSPRTMAALERRGDAGQARRLAGEHLPR